MEKKPLKDCIYHSKVLEHNTIKDFLLNEIQLDALESLEATADKNCIHKISKLDWNKSTDFDRNWVKSFLPYFSSTVGKIFTNSPFNSIDLKQIWYQQYLKSDIHGWHIHGCHFTGVYYLEFPLGSAKTELFLPLDNSFEQVDVVEGDIIVFPSHIIHRSMINHHHRKTIISFNFDIRNDLNFIFLSDRYNEFNPDSQLSSNP